MCFIGQPLETNDYYGGGQGHYFGGGSESSNIHPAVLVALCIAGVLILILPRKQVIYSFVFGSIIIPYYQNIVILGFHFPALRILIFLGWMRLIASGYLTDDASPLRRMNSIDKAMLLWVTSNVVMFTILWAQLGALTNQLGFLYTDLGTYFLLRFLIRDQDGIERAIKALAILCFGFGLMMLNEQLTGRNLFGLIGGVPLEVVMREGKLRSQASFLHPLLAGAFGGTLVTLFVGLWLRRRSARTTAAAGIIGGTMMAICSMSSTSLIAIVAGVFGLCLWPLRRRMRAVRWSIVTTLITLHLVMKAPVWALIARIDLTGGSSGYHRYELIDQAIRHFSEWWLVGTKTQSLWGWDMWDSIDWYVNVATSGGLITLILFVTVLVHSFKAIGSARKAAALQRNRRGELFIWAVGATLFANVLSFIGICYFDQTIVMWLTFVAIIAALRVTPRPDTIGEVQKEDPTSILRLSEYVSMTYP
jgi:hypothetical protein